MRHARLHAKEWGGDPARLLLSGQSSGANIAASALLGHSPEVPHCAGYVGLAGVYDVETHFLYEKRRGDLWLLQKLYHDYYIMKSALSIYHNDSAPYYIMIIILYYIDSLGLQGLHNISPLAVACEPLSLQSPTKVAAELQLPLACDRVLILHGEKDHTLPVSGSAMFAMQLQRNQHRVQLMVTPTDDHVSFLIDMMLGRDSEMLDIIKDFCMHMGSDQDVRLSDRTKLFHSKL